MPLHVALTGEPKIAGFTLKLAVVDEVVAVYEVVLEENDGEIAIDVIELSRRPSEFKFAFAPVVASINTITIGSTRLILVPEVKSK